MTLHWRDRLAATRIISAAKTPASVSNGPFVLTFGKLYQLQATNVNEMFAAVGLAAMEA